MAIIAKYRCECCQKSRSYKVITAEQFDAARVVCMACRRKYPQTARDILLR